MSEKIVRKYGWIKDTPDARDKKYAKPRGLKRPKKVDLRSACSPIEDQKSTGSCTANAAVGLLEFLEIKDNVLFKDFSRLYVYYNERVIDGTVDEDAGSQLRTAAKALAQWGACNEKLWPYDEKKFTKKPPAKCYTDGEKHKITVYRRLDSLDDILDCLAEGYPVMFGFEVYECMQSLEVAKTGHLPMPKPNEELIGGHAVVFVGYDVDKKLFIVRNSWGPGWGDKGYFYMPFSYITEGLASDFWTIRKGIGM
jgi:C1A family cysteine protease